MTPRRLLAIAAAPTLAALLLASCSSGDHSSGDHSSNTTSTTAAIPADAAFNAADVTFAQSMIPHHAQAVEMADMAIAESSNAKVLELARAIKGAQRPEIDAMTAWLTSWGQPIPDTSMSAHAGHDMSDSSTMKMDGMMSAADMERLDQATGSAFDRLWTELMIQHHEGAVTMARAELANGKFPAAKQMADAIITGQTAEIATMKALLASTPS